ncbi:hypothetical protein BIY23_04340 [Wolbachia pipientis]|uniref:Uncharacterized protein n=1 Tax=Wolbachia pipientis TaxID=955 RepID=A0A1E7QIZ1_WOLPI|nr:hypothetical protein [Wolbachia pipientis]OEY86425.1 hypothetical protein BIY23_04340 [Wolbachia pipientis]
MVIESKIKNVEGECSYFEQRATNSEEEKSYYFNQPVVMFPITEGNKSVVENIVKNMHISIEKCGIGLAHNQYPKQDGAINPFYYRWERRL